MYTVRKSWSDFYEVVNTRGRVLSLHTDWISAELKADRLNRRKQPAA